MTNAWRIGMAFCLVLATAPVASAQAPHDLSVCVSIPAQRPTCEDAGGPVVFTECSRQFETFLSQIAWYPLQCVGPIVVEVENTASWFTRFPIYVEVVPLRNPPAVCVNDFGYVVFIVYGASNSCEGEWATSDPIDITPVVPIGALYALRLRSFGLDGGHSPAIDCVRVTSRSILSDGAQGSWTNIKRLYR